MSRRPFPSSQWVPEEQVSVSGRQKRSQGAGWDERAGTGPEELDTDDLRPPKGIERP